MDRANVDAINQIRLERVITLLEKDAEQRERDKETVIRLEERCIRIENDQKQILNKIDDHHNLSMGIKDQQTKNTLNIKRNTKAIEDFGIKKLLALVSAFIGALIMMWGIFQNWGR